MNVYQRLQAARIKLQNTKLEKSGHNKFAGYKYFELGDFLPTIQNLFDEFGLFGAVSFDSDKASLVIRNVEKPDELITFYSPMGSAALKGCHEVQNIGAVETYQRRYLWVTAMEIVEHDALDAGAEKEDKPVKKETRLGGLSEVDMDNVCMAMEETSEFDGLKSIFAPAYSKADERQKTALKKTYDGIKLKRKWS